MEAREEPAAGARTPSHGVLVLPASESARSGSLLSLCPLRALLVAAVQLTRMQRRGPCARWCPRAISYLLSLISFAIFHSFFSPGSGGLRMRASAHRHPPEYLVLLGVSACLAHRVGWRRESSGTSALQWVGYSLELADLFLYFVQFYNMDPRHAPERGVFSVSPRIAAPLRVVHTMSGGERAPRAPPRLPRLLRDDGHGHPQPDYEREDGYEREAGRASGLSSTAPPPSCRTTALVPAAYEDRRCVTSGVNEGAERAHPRDWPTRRRYEVRDLERDVDVFALALTPSSRRPLLALGFLRADYEDADRECE
ncbi:hypothetical protein B0H13DRAFT_2455033 [Mycena leptocephala]|nr:hypothetical protein B0H13DRAFT_2455033 [Mycena leptocephala]